MENEKQNKFQRTQTSDSENEIIHQKTENLEIISINQNVHNKLPKANDLLNSGFKQESVKYAIDVKFQDLPKFEGQIPKREELQLKQHTKNDNQLSWFSSDVPLHIFELFKNEENIVYKKFPQIKIEKEKFNLVFCELKHLISLQQQFCLMGEYIDRIKKNNNATQGNTNQNQNENNFEPFYKLKSNKDQTIQFESKFESGNLALASKVSDLEYNLLLQNDINTKGNTQWFFFSIKNGIKKTNRKFNIINFSKPASLFNLGMKVLVYSKQKAKHQNIGWHRGGREINYFRSKFIKNEEDKSKPYYSLTFVYDIEYDDDEIFFAYNYPYTYTDLQKYLQQILNDKQKSQFVSQKLLCRTLAGNRVDVLTITSNKGPYKQNQKQGIILSARVHPGETVSSFVMKGVIDFLLSDTQMACTMRERFIFKIIPMLNPDGVIHGNYRSSLSGQDLNRQWVNPSKYIHPEIYHTKKLINKFMTQTELSLFCDLHGHSAKKNIFMYGCHDNKKPYECREFPFIISKIFQPFSFTDCNFVIKEEKKGTARVELYDKLGISNVFTLESSFCGPSYDNIHFRHQDFEQMGKKLCQAIDIYFEPLVKIQKNNNNNNNKKQQNKQKQNKLNNSSISSLKHLNNNNDENYNQSLQMNTENNQQLENISENDILQESEYLKQKDNEEDEEEEEDFSNFSKFQLKQNFFQELQNSKNDIINAGLKNDSDGSNSVPSEDEVETKDTENFLSSSIKNELQINISNRYDKTQKRQHRFKSCHNQNSQSQYSYQIQQKNENSNKYQEVDLKKQQLQSIYSDLINLTQSQTNSPKNNNKNKNNMYVLQHKHSQGSNQTASSRYNINNIIKETQDEIITLKQFQQQQPVLKTIIAANKIDLQLQSDFQHMYIQNNDDKFQKQPQAINIQEFRMPPQQKLNSQLQQVRYKNLLDPQSSCQIQGYSLNISPSKNQYSHQNVQELIQEQQQQNLKQQQLQNQQQQLMDQNFLKKVQQHLSKSYILQPQKQANQIIMQTQQQIDQQQYIQQQQISNNQKKQQTIVEQVINKKLKSSINLPNTIIVEQSNNNQEEESPIKKQNQNIFKLLPNLNSQYSQIKNQIINQADGIYPSLDMIDKYLSTISMSNQVQNNNEQYGSYLNSRNYNNGNNYVIKNNQNFTTQRSSVSPDKKKYYQLNSMHSSSVSNQKYINAAILQSEILNTDKLDNINNCNINNKQQQNLQPKTEDINLESINLKQNNNNNLKQQQQQSPLKEKIHVYRQTRYISNGVNNFIKSKRKIQGSPTKILNIQQQLVQSDFLLQQQLYQQINTTPTLMNKNSQKINKI